jgi:hypothetical protein
MGTAPDPAAAPCAEGVCMGTACVSAVTASSAIGARIQFRSVRIILSLIFLKILDVWFLVGLWMRRFAKGDKRSIASAVLAKH